jgi:glycosyltransferase involved in cell wall biosynthesis
MHVALVTGSVPPERCGVGDYTVALQQALVAEGIDARVVTHDAWQPGAMAAVRAKIKAVGAPVLVHIQYPTAGFGAQLGPQVLALNAGGPVIVTLHEFSQAHILRKLASLAFSLRVGRLIFTTEDERRSFVRVFPWTAGRTEIVPLASNIPFVDGQPEEGPPTIVTFGQIRPEKGLEEFLELVWTASKLARPYRFEIIGAAMPKFREYAERLRKDHAEFPIAWLSDLEPRQVAERLARAHAAYLPFPDGASGRRGSLLAVLGNGVPTVTTDGPERPADLENVVAFAASPSEALIKLDEILASPQLSASLRAAGKAYTAPLTWDAIARRHLTIYRSLLAPA